MSDDGPGAADRTSDARWPGGEPQRGKWAELRLAAGFLTILPLMPRGASAPDTVAASYGWFPLVGFALGAILAVENRLLAPLLGDALAAVVLVLTLVALTGAVHLDALADTADALGAGADRRRALDIMRDSRVGSFGAAAIFFFLALEIVALASMGEARRTTALWLAPGLARWAMVAVGWRIDYLRAAGAGSALVGHRRDRNFVLACVIAALAALAVLSARTLAAYAVALALAAIMRAAYRRWLGGVTGDLLGAAGELVEAAVLLVIAAI